MAVTQYVGYQQTVTWNAVAIEGLQEATLTEDAGPSVEQIDVTAATDATYQYLADPWGAKGNPSVKFVVKGLDSYDSIDDTKNKAHAFNDKQALVWATEPATATSNQYDHTALELTERVTEITWTEPYATFTLTFEGTAIGAWSGPA